MAELATCPFNIGDVVRAKGQQQAMTVLELGSTWKDLKQHHLVAVWVEGIGEKWLPWAALEPSQTRTADTSSVGRYGGDRVVLSRAVERERVNRLASVIWKSWGLGDTSYDFDWVAAAEAAQSYTVRGTAIDVIRVVQAAQAVLSVRDGAEA